ncbi:PREDICTED: uncharacterized protein LOC105359806 isoform X2 [Ceratosolen solmsi marchali]|uniref:Uncharacterized protein LOC105359806 isoform X2 n=1 Tax=Ceratosolen solmsi marchali TaxID=326594 RepID=A0AAJ6YC51_9HYME|nr:PREDICTED: uncharacterized protein LOC105359806 isoform X2 [Ceratosolen solmsi marchali]
MLVHICLLALLGFGTSLEIEKVMPSQYEIEGSINRTIEEVEKMIGNNPSLPKLSRGDIVNILYNITSKDMLSIEDETLGALQKMRSDYQRALMVVLPYKLKSSENLKDLYTKPPIVQILEDGDLDNKKATRLEATYNPSTYSAHMKVNGDKSSGAPVKMDAHYLKTMADVLNDTNVKFEPQKYNFNFDLIDQRAEASQTSIATKRPIYKGTFSRYRTSTQSPPRLEIIYSSTSTRKPTTGNKPDTTIVQNKSTQNILSSDQWQYYAPPSTTTTHKTTMPDNPLWEPMSAFVPTDAPIKPAPIFVTPSAMINQETTYSNVNNEAIIINVTSTTVKSTPMRQDVELLLKSIGLEPIKSTDPKNSIKFMKNTIDSQLNIHSHSNNQNSKLEAVRSNLSNTLHNNSIASSSLKMKDNIKNLSPDIQLLFKQFGLQSHNQNDIPAFTTPKSTTVTAIINSYTRFKPLPTSSVRDKDFRNFLARFGLGIGASRNEKAMQQLQTTKRPSLIDAVPENMKRILENIGLIKTSQRGESKFKEDINFQTQSSKIVEQTTLSSEHIFKPYESAIEDKEQNNKIKNLLNTVRMVQEGRANVQDVQDIANDLLSNTKSLENGPDPLKLEAILNNYKNSLKNEVKRQQAQVTSTSTSTATSTLADLDETTPSVIATTESSGSFSESITSSPLVGDNSKEPKISQSSISSTVTTQATQPSFFDTFDISDYLNKTESDSSNTVTSAESSSTSENSTKSSFFDTFDINDYTNNTADENSAKVADANLPDLEASFGGSTAEPDPVIPTRPKTGLYFLVDWNTFLEVGEEGKEKVNLRFAPKVGDRSRFLSVKMP